MKKLLGLVIISLLVLSLAACGEAQVEKDPILGAWEMPTQISILGVLPADSMQAQTLDATIHFEFNEDKTGRWLTIFDEQYNRLVPDADVSFTYTLEGDKLVLSRESGQVNQFTVSFADNKLVLAGRVPMELERAK